MRVEVSAAGPSEAAQATHNANQALFAKEAELVQTINTHVEKVETANSVETDVKTTPTTTTTTMLL